MKSYAQQVQHKTILAMMALRWTCQYIHARLHLHSVAFEVLSSGAYCSGQHDATLPARGACCHATGYASPAGQAQLLSVQHQGAHSETAPAQEAALPSYSWHMTGLLGAPATHTHPAESNQLHA